MIIAENLSKAFELSKKQRKALNTDKKNVLAVDNLSFKCEPGRVFSLLGPNGAGKTTTLRMLAGIFKPTKGEITIAGIDAVKSPLKASEKIGFLTGSTALYGRLTPNELVDYFAHLYSVNTNDLKIRKERLFTLLDMHEFQNKRIAKLSTGMKQKVSICRTMIHDPEVLIFDEPTSGLDVVSAANIIQLIKDSKNEGKTIIFSSHIMSEVELLTDDLAIVNNGKLLYNDTLANFIGNIKTKNITTEFIRIVNENQY